ncbi:YcnI family protein [Streptomyces albidus (ex Kaewkla and Franco 2022)]|uniref:YcnI family copper-binding membrane protein n=1 Tax=Streptomyces albidus (ex Kaewkla and Franco 2022) TaxID=722709 RepID=UPI0015EF4746|nr:YcnI family protein [Streptomyces albidus (ex Kaewkla and Franco 2022)]
MKSTPRRRLAVVGALAATSVVLCAGPALAHVSVDPEQAEQGGYSVVNFKVPNERDDAATTKLEVNLPTDHPLASVMPQPVPGWDVKVTKSKLDKPIEMHGEKITEAVTKITWTGGKVETGEFQQFPVSMGQLPEDTDQIAFKALQTYDDKEVVRWIEEPKEGQPEPENPAPVLKLTPASAEHSDAKGGAAGSAEKASAEDGGSKDAEASGTDSTARVLGVVGIVAGVAGVAFGVLAGRRRSA